MPCRLSGTNPLDRLNEVLDMTYSTPPPFSRPAPWLSQPRLPQSQRTVADPRLHGREMGVCENHHRYVSITEGERRIDGFACRYRSGRFDPEKGVP